MDRLTETMKRLTEIDGVPGFEREVRQQLQSMLEPLTEELLKDRLGSVIGKKTGDAAGPSILLAGHLDEVGFMVKHITAKGFIRFQNLGGWWSHAILSQRVRIKSRKGDYIGIVGSKPPHVLTPEERKKVVPLDEMFIDVGARSKEEVEEMGIRLGDPIIPVSEFFTMRDGELWAGKALDNRSGCALAVEVLSRLQQQAHPNVVYAGATVQEEVGLRGAGTTANLIKPDFAFALDVGVAYDTPGLDHLHTTANMGEGPVLFLADASMIGHVGLREFVLDTAKELNIPVQVMTMMGGGTDAGKFHMSGIGCPSLAIGFATRYIHSHNALMAKKDFELAADLLTAVISRLDAATAERLFEA